MPMITEIMERILICIFLVMKSQKLSSDCQECEDYLISGPRGIPDSHLTASSSFPNDPPNLHDQTYGRLYYFVVTETTGAAAWTARYDNDQQYIQAMFTSVKIVKAILTQGRANSDQWVSSYSVSYSTDNITWSNVQSPDNTTMIFPANTDRTTVVNNTLPECVKAKYLRIHPKTWHNYVSLRFDVIGCPALATKRVQNQMNWKRHPVDWSPIVSQNIRKSNMSSQDTLYCAIQCQNNEECVMFRFSKKDGTCTGFPVRIYQGKITASSSSENGQYFMSIPHLHEYELVESKMFVYKIFTWSTTAELALNRCQNEGVWLLTIHDLDQMKYVQNKIKDNLILSQKSKYFVDGSYKDGKWTYSTGVDVPSGLWSPSHPLTNNDGCVTLTSAGGLETHDCNDCLYFVCGV